REKNQLNSQVSNHSCKHRIPKTEHRTPTPSRPYARRPLSRSYLPRGNEVRSGNPRTSVSSRYKDSARDESPDARTESNGLAESPSSDPARFLRVRCS